MTIKDAVANRITQSMNRILTGQNKTITLTTLYKLARDFNMTIFEFLGDDNFRSKDLEID